MSCTKICHLFIYPKISKIFAQQFLKPYKKSIDKIMHYNIYTYSVRVHVRIILTRAIDILRFFPFCFLFLNLLINI